MVGFERRRVAWVEIQGVLWAFFGIGLRCLSSLPERGLLDREWVSQKGVREVPGRPALYVTTSKFLEYFGLMRLADLPVLGEQRQLNEIARELGIILPRAEGEVVADEIVAKDIEPGEGVNRSDHSHVSSIGETSPAIEAEPEVDVDDGPDKLLEADVSAIG